jgi:hypothetical protein
MAASGYWSPPHIEESRLAEACECVGKHLGDSSNIVFFISKSGNKNFTYYEYFETPDSFGIRPQWAMQELKLLADGQVQREELTITEQVLLGVNVVTRPSGTINVNFNPEQIRTRAGELILDAAGKPALVGTVDGHTCRLLHAYVQMKKNLLPDVDYITLYGRGLSDGKMYMERMTNTGTQASWM